VIFELLAQFGFQQLAGGGMRKFIDEDYVVRNSPLGNAL